MPLQIQGASGNVADVDASGNIYRRRYPVNFGSLGGAFSVSGGPSAVVAAALAANTPLVTLRHGAAATTNLWITRMHFGISVATVGASGGVPGLIAWQKFSGATPTGGTARTPARKDTASGSASQVGDVRDSNAALTVTGVTFADVFVQHVLPNSTTGLAIEYGGDFDEDEFIRLQAGEGIALRTQTAAPATQTWIYSYTIHWIEK